MVLIKIKRSLEKKLFQNVKFTLENQMEMILAILMKQMKVSFIVDENLLKVCLLFALYNHCALSLQFS